MAYLVAPPMEATIGLDAALKAADVRVAEGLPAADRDELRGAWLTGDLPACEAAAMAFAEAVVEVGRRPREL